MKRPPEYSEFTEGYAKTLLVMLRLCSFLSEKDNQEDQDQN